MSFVKDLFDPSKGVGFQAGQANVVNGFNQTGAQAGANQSQQAYQQQQSLLNALAAQNGLGNQSSVFNQLQGVANGTGPNPAQAMLNQSTGQNVANQAALMASQRGTSSNPGLIARQAAQQGANIQQQAAGQGATMQANQSLGALGQLGGLANQQVANQIGGVAGLNNAAQGIEGLYNQGVANQNNANVGMQSNQNNANAGIANTNAQNQIGMFNSTANGASKLLSSAHGGVVRNPMADGGVAELPPIQQPLAPATIQGPSSMLGQALQPNVGQGFTPIPLPKEDSMDGGGSGGDSGGGGLGSVLKLAAFLNKGGKVPAIVSPGEIYLSPDKAKAVAEGKASPLSGERIKGKAKVPGDSLKNDTIPKTLDEGGVVIPRSKALGNDVSKKAQEFVMAVMAHQGIKGKK